MPTRHPHPRALEQLASGQLQGEPLVELLKHLADCARCRSLMGRAILTSPARPPEPRQPTRIYDRAFQRASAGGGRALREIRLEQKKASCLIPYLLSLPAPDLRRLIRSSSHLRSYALSEKLLSSSQSNWFDDPALAEKKTALALLVSDHLDSHTYGRRILEDLRAESWAFLANVRRIRSDYEGASTAFDQARDHRRQGTGDPSEHARLLVLYARLLEDLGRPDAAQEHIDHAIFLYREMRDRHMEARSLLTKSSLERERGDLDSSMRLLLRAAKGIDKESEPRLLLIMRRKRAWTLARFGGRANLQRSLAEIDPAREEERLERMRSLWVRGLLLEKLGRVRESERDLHRAREGFARAGIPMDVALLDLDLARTHLSRDRPAEALRHTISAFPVLASRKRQQDTLRALDLFRQAGGVA